MAEQRKRKNAPRSAERRRNAAIASRKNGPAKGGRPAPPHPAAAGKKVRGKDKPVPRGNMAGTSKTASETTQVQWFGEPRKKPASETTQVQRFGEPRKKSASETTQVQWFPGHMAKTRRLITESLKQVDLILEIVDARIPQSSRNPELDKWVENKPRVIMLNKSDNADPEATRRWLEYYRTRGLPAFACDCKTGTGVNQFIPLVKRTLLELLERRKNKGMSGQMIRIMVVGVPNVGKSSFINRMAGAKRAKTEDRPGVTRGRQWVSLDKDVELLDMPGVLWPKFDDPLVGEKLAFTGAVKDDVVDREQLASRLLELLAAEYPDRLAERYGMTEIEGLAGWELLEELGRRRGMLIAGGGVHTERAAITFMDEYRAGKLGKLTFELPPDLGGTKE